MLWTQLSHDNWLEVAEGYYNDADLPDWLEDTPVDTVRRRVGEWLSHYTGFLKGLTDQALVDVAEQLLSYPTVAHKVRESGVLLYEISSLAEGIDDFPCGREEFPFDEERESVEERITLPAIEASDAERQDNALILEGDGGMMLVSDLEVGQHNVTLLRRLLSKAATENVKKLCIVGDAIHTDQFSPWPLTRRELRRSYSKDLMTLVKVIRSMFEWFNEITILTGNHDYRLERATKGELSLDTLLDIVESLGGGISRDKARTLEVTDLNHVYVCSNRGPWLLAHPFSGGSRVAGTLGRKLYEVERIPPALRARYGDVKPHIIEPHTHRWGLMTTPDGARQIVAIGCGRDPRLTPYIRNKSTHAVWDEAFGMIDPAGFGNAWHMEHSNWKVLIDPKFYSYAEVR